MERNLQLHKLLICCISFSDSMNQFDAILFFIGHWTVGHISLPNQYNRKSSQYYVMFLMEGPLNERFPYEKYKNFFNWTMTYRRDSDFYTPYGWIAPKNWEWHYPPVKPVNWKQYMKSGILAKSNYLASFNFDTFEFSTNLANL